MRLDNNYQEFIESEQWQIIRHARLLLDNYECQTCGNTKNLQVHHRYNGAPYYGHKKPLGKEDPKDCLITLCKDCHDVITKSVRSRRGKRG